MSLYPQEQVGGKKRYLHRARAEKALGRPLPKGVVVHHADGTRDVDGPLVICQDQSYHWLLHRRMRVLAAGGNPNTDKLCSACRTAKPAEDFTTTSSQPDGRSCTCRPCTAVASNRRYYARKAKAA